MSTDEALTEQIARATCGSPSDYEWRTWGEDDPGLRVLTLQYAARLLPIIRKARADAWDEGENAGFLHGRWDEYTINPYITEEDA